MKPLSSIFSFETLKPGPFTCRALALALGLVLLAEGAVRVAAWRDWLPADAGLEAHMESQKKRVAVAPREVWWMGNSTLGSAFDRKTWEKSRSDEPFILIHGSSSLRGDAALLEFYLRSAPAPPKELVVFNQPTHMSLHGRGPGRDTEPVYLEVGRTGKLPKSDPLAMQRLRSHMAAILERRFFMLFSGPSDSGGTAFMSAENQAYFSQIFADYETDLGAFDELARVARSHGIGRVVFVMMPVSHDLKDWFDSRGQGRKYADVVEEVRRACGAAQIEFRDGTVVTEATEDFRDPYHLNKHGAVRFTESLLSWNMPAGREQAR